jgi:hypothetical protein
MPVIYKKLLYFGFMAAALSAAGFYFAQLIILYPLPFHLTDNIHVFSINTFNVTRRIMADAVIGLILLALYVISWRNFLVTVNTQHTTTIRKD